MQLKTLIIIGLVLITGSGMFYMTMISTQDPKEYFQELLDHADIKINGSRPWDIKVHNDQLYARVMKQGSLGLGEAYMDGWWDVESLDQFFHKLLAADIQNKIAFNWTLLLQMAKAYCMNCQSSDRAFQVGEKHYDLDNDLFAAMLDKNMVYSCGYWKSAATLDQAQECKLNLICKKLHMHPGMSVLDIGCGWGGLAAYMAQNYGAHVQGITVSKEQAKLAQSRYPGIPVTFIVKDYRDLNEQFDRIVSVGMFEHVGYKNYRTFMEKAHASLKDDGLMLLHTIGSNYSTTSGDAWLDKYIFTNGMLPSIKQIAQAAEGLFIIEDWHNFGADYDKTLMSWFTRFNEQWPTLQSRYSDRFYRMWKYYLLSCAGLFRARKAQLWQIVLSKNGVPGGYESIR